MTKRYNYKDNFEMLYLRHDRLAKCGRLNGSHIKEYAPIVNQTSRIVYDKNRKVFTSMGFEIEDIITVTNMYMLTYMEMYSLVENEEAKSKLVMKFIARGNKPPSEVDIKNIDKNNLINFLRQNLPVFAGICAKKARNSVGSVTTERFFAHTEDSLEGVDDLLILEDPAKFGYRRVAKKEWAECKESGLDKDGFIVFSIKQVQTEYLADSYRLTTYGTFEGSTPETDILDYEQSVILELWKDQFNTMAEDEKKNVLETFIEENKDDQEYSTEIRVARKMLKQKQYMVS